MSFKTFQTSAAVKIHPAEPACLPACYRTFCRNRGGLAIYIPMTYFCICRLLIAA